MYNEFDFPNLNYTKVGGIYEVEYVATHAHIILPIIWQKYFWNKSTDIPLGHGGLNGDTYKLIQLPSWG